MIGLIQGFIYYFLIDMDLTRLRFGDFLMLSLITVVIAGSGYIINDFFDYRMDEVNKPDKWIAGNLWSLKKVLNVYWLTVALGAVLSIILAIRLMLLPFLFIYPLAVGALWLYSYALKCKPVIGNLWVAIFCAGVLIVVALPDWLGGDPSAISIHLGYYTSFAFLATWYREIVKDIEDAAGDRLLACKTFVVRFGIRPAKIMALGIVAVLTYAVFQWSTIQSSGSIAMALNILQGFIVTSMAFVWWAKDKTYYHMASVFIKGVMLLGTIVLLFL